MATYASLKRQARAAATARGHALGKFPKVPAWAQEMGGKSTADCTKCSAWVQVIAKPMPNEIGIGGSAVSVNCREA